MKTDTLKPFKLVKKNKTKDQLCSIYAAQLVGNLIFRMESKNNM